MPSELVLPSGVLIPSDLGRPIRDLRTTHIFVQTRWAVLKPLLEAAGFAMLENEAYRTEERQRWLWAQGRTVEQCRRNGVPVKYARGGNIVTNSWSARNSAHGWTQSVGVGKVVPAACAIDVVPLGTDGKPWTKDDPWDTWYTFLCQPTILAIGLVHFHKPGKKPWDMPHLQLKEWSDQLKRLVI